MLRSIEELEKYGVQANDGPMGHVRDFFFDDASWVVRYVVVDTGGWLWDRKVLISPISIGQVDPAQKRLQVLLDREKIEKSPDFDSHKPVSRQHEKRYFEYYGYPCYWGGSGLWGDGSFPSLMLSDIDDRADSGNAVGQQRQRLDVGRPLEHGRVSAHTKRNVTMGESSAAASEETDSATPDDPHLRSCKSLRNYEIQANDGLIGHVEGFLVDEEAWAIRHIIVKTSHWWLGHRVLIRPDWISSVDWLENTVRVAVSRVAIKEAPPWKSSEAFDHKQREGLHTSHDRIENPTRLF